VCKLKRLCLHRRKTVYDAKKERQREMHAYKKKYNKKKKHKLFKLATHEVNNNTCVCVPIYTTQ